MAQFWILATLLLVLALVIVLLPLVRARTNDKLVSKDANVAIARQRLSELQADQEQGLLSQEKFAAAEADIQAQLLSDVADDVVESASTNTQSRLPALLILIALPVMAIGLYSTLGSQQWLTPDLVDIDSDLAQLESIEDMVGNLESKLENNQQDLEGWLMLGRSYTYLNKLDAALHAFEKAYALSPDNADVLLSYAAALGRSEEGWLTGKPAQLLELAYQKHPEHPQVLFLIGHLRYQQKNIDAAMTLWQKLLTTLPADSEDAQQVHDAIKLAQAEASAVQSKSAEASSAAPVTDAQQIHLRVSLASEFQAKVNAEDAVFIYARAVQGSRMPLAVVKKQVKDLPLNVTLTDSMAMTPAMRLSQFPQVSLEARVSMSGDPIPQSGDLVVSYSPAEVGSEQVYDLLIDQVLP